VFEDLMLGSEHLFQLSPAVLKPNQPSRQGSIAPVLADDRFPTRVRISLLTSQRVSVI
jgi:hypothetical protein